MEQLQKIYDIAMRQVEETRTLQANAESQNDLPTAAALGQTIASLLATAQAAAGSVNKNDRVTGRYQ